MGFMGHPVENFCQKNVTTIGIRPPNSEEEMYAIALTFVLSTIWIWIHS